MTRICMITREFPPQSGGIGYYVYNLSKKLIDRGHKITVITRGTPNKSTKEVIEGIDVFQASFFPLYPFHTWIHGVFVNMLLKSLGSFDVVHMHSPLPPLVKTSFPVITTVHTTSKVDSKYHEVLDFYSLAEKVQSMVMYPPIESKLFEISDSITTVSFSVANELRNYGIDPAEITVLGNGVDQKEFMPACVKNDAQKYVLYTGVLRARKGLFDLLECADFVSKVRSDINFLVCGTGPFYGKLREKVEEKKLKNVSLLGYVSRDNLIELYQNATVHVVPSHYEGLPTVLLEAMSCGLPVVATNVCGNKEVISNGVNGFLVPSKSPKLMADIILRLLQDYDLRERIGKAARNTIKQRYTWDKITDNIVECYKKVRKN